MEQGLLVQVGGHIPGALRGWFETRISEWGRDSVGLLGECWPSLSTQGPGIGELGL